MRTGASAVPGGGIHCETAFWAPGECRLLVGGWRLWRSVRDGPWQAPPWCPQQMQTRAVGRAGPVFPLLGEAEEA